MAVRGIENAIYCVRNGGVPYWKIYENQAKRTAGAFMAQSSSDKDLSMDAAMSELYTALSRLTPDGYLLVSFKEPGSNRPVIDIKVEIGYDERRGNSHVAGIGSTFSIEGIGAVTMENFEAALDKKVNDMLAKQKAEAELTALKDEVKRLKAEATENDGGFKKGIASIGAALYPYFSKTQAFKEVVTAVNGFKNTVGNDDSDSAVNHLGAAPDDAEERIGAAVEALAQNNPNIVKELELLAKLKKQNPSLYREGVDFAASMADEN